MTFPVLETSRDAGSLVEFLTFERDGVFYRYTTAETDQVLDGEAFEALEGLSHGPLEQTDENISMQLRIQMPRDASIAEEFIGSPVAAAVSVLLHVNHRGAPDGDKRVGWMGEVAGVSFQDSTLELLCTTEEAQWGNQLGRFPFQSQCPNMLYDTLCGVDPIPHTFDATVSSISVDGRTLTVTGPVDLGSVPSRYDLGVVLTGTRMGFILREDPAGVLHLQTPLALAVGAAVQIRHGCRRTYADCRDVFANNDRYQGYLLIPMRDFWRRVT